MAKGAHILTPAAVFVQIIVQRVGSRLVVIELRFARVQFPNPQTSKKRMPKALRLANVWLGILFGRTLSIALPFGAGMSGMMDVLVGHFEMTLDRELWQNQLAKSAGAAAMWHGCSFVTRAYVVRESESPPLLTQAWPRSGAWPSRRATIPCSTSLSTAARFALFPHSTRSTCRFVRVEEEVRVKKG